MVQIETVDLSVHGIVFPADRIGIVAAQPYLTLTNNEPFTCSPAQSEAQLAMVARTLAIAKARPHGQAKTHFTLFPEYSIPGLAGAQRIDEALAEADWPTGTVVIGGVDALTKAEYAALVGQQNSHVNAQANTATSVKNNKWVNCGILWVKAEDGVVHRWIQPKLTPAWPELDISYLEMFHGGSVFIFKGRLSNQAFYRFSMLICFDWISTLQERLLWRHVLDDLAEQSAQAGAELAVSWLFVIQHNRKPSHASFLSQVPPFFDQNTLPTVRRERACIVFANTAGLHKPGRVNEYGSSSLVFSGSTLFEKPTCPMTFAMGRPDLRANSTILNPYYDVFLREGGACIYSFVQINPGSLVAGAAGRQHAVEEAEVFPIDDTVDPRAPSGAVPAGVKWLNDELDDVKSLKDKFPLAPLRDEADARHGTTVAGFRDLPPPKIAFLLSAGVVQDAADADKWGTAERIALNLLVHTQEILAISYPAEPVPGDSSFPIVTVDGHRLDVIVIAGQSHEGCWKQAERSVALGAHQSLVVTKDPDNTIWQRQSGSILQGDAAKLGAEPNFTDPMSNVLHISYQELLSAYLDAQDTVGLENEVRAKFA